jgi:hypothetical protein
LGSIRSSKDVLPPAAPEIGRAGVVYWCAVAAIAALGLYLRREALWAGFVGDDYAQLGMLDGQYPLPRAPYNLFSFSDGTASEGFRLMRAGFYPWWVDPGLRLTMLRPLASLMIALDHRLFGSDAFLFHLHSAAWWFVMLGTIAAFFRKLFPLPVALVAFGLLALDEAHLIALTWICNRCAFVSIAFSVLALGAYVAHRRSGSTRWPLVAVLFFFVAFGFGEYSVGLLAYLAAYEVCEGTGTPRERLRAVAPMLVPALVFFVARSILGATVLRSGAYVDPIREPLDYLQAVLFRVPVFVGDLLIALHSDFWMFVPPFVFKLVTAGVVPLNWVRDVQPWRLVQSGIGVGACVLLYVFYRHTLRGEQNRTARWLLFGSILGLVPMCASYPSSRLLLFSLIGFTPLVATFVVRGTSALFTAFHDNRARAIALAAGPLAVGAFHVVVPVALQRLELPEFVDGTRRVREAILAMPVDDAEFPKQDLMLLTSIDGASSMYVPLTRLRYGKSAPHTCLPFSFLISPYELERTGVNAFTVRFGNEDSLLGTANEQILRSPRHPFHQSDVVDLGAFRVTILGTYRERPQYLRVEFDRPLDDPSLLFMALTPDGYRRFFMPPVGGKVLILPAALPDVRKAPPARRSS